MPTRLEQVLQNLVENAVKYGREGGEVRLACAHAPPGGRFPRRPGVLLSVSDDGPGIPKADVPRLTERFYRVDKGRSRDAGGTGLGLAIVKHIVNRHRGQLVIESEEGRGSAFSVWLPADRLRSLGSPPMTPSSQATAPSATRRLDYRRAGLPRRPRRACASSWTATATLVTSKLTLRRNPASPTRPPR